MQVLCLQVATAAGDYQLDLFHLLMCLYKSHKSFLLQWAATAKSILEVQLSFAAFLRVFSLVNSGFTYQQGLSLQDYNMEKLHADHS